MLVVVVSMAIIIMDLYIADLSKNPGKTTDISHTCHKAERCQIGLTRTTNEQLTLRIYYLLFESNTLNQYFMTTITEF